MSLTVDECFLDSLPADELTFACKRLQLSRTNPISEVGQPTL